MACLCLLICEKTVMCVQVMKTLQQSWIAENFSMFSCLSYRFSYLSYRFSSFFFFASMFLCFWCSNGCTPPRRFSPPNKEEGLSDLSLLHLWAAISSCNVPPHCYGNEHRHGGIYRYRPRRCYVHAALVVSSNFHYKLCVCKYLHGWRWNLNLEESIRSWQVTSSIF